MSYKFNLQFSAMHVFVITFVNFIKILLLLFWEFIYYAWVCPIYTIKTQKAISSIYNVSSVGMYEIV